MSSAVLSQTGGEEGRDGGVMVVGQRDRVRPEGMWLLSVDDDDDEVIDNRTK
jgi:hypothetical protein